MHERLEHFISLPPLQKIAGLLAALLVLFALYWALFYRPIGGELSALEQTLEGPKGLRARVAEREGVANNLVHFRAEVQVLDGELKKALAELPDSRETPDLLTKVSDRGREVGLEIRSFKPLPQQKKEFYAEVPVELEVYGTYHQLAAFFDGVGRLERIVNLDAFELGRHRGADVEAPEGEVRLKTTVRATTFRFLEESERPKAEETEGASKRRRRRGGAKAAQEEDGL
jgi:type IV pilus assembly protein PilO